MYSVSRLFFGLGWNFVGFLEQGDRIGTWALQYKKEDKLEEQKNEIIDKYQCVYSLCEIVKLNFFCFHIFILSCLRESISESLSTTLGFPINLCEVGCAVAAWQLLFWCLIH